MKMMKPMVVLFSSILSTSILSSCIKWSGSDQSLVPTQSAEAEKLSNSERDELLLFLKEYASSIGGQNPSKIRGFLGSDLQKMWGEQAIQNLASTEPIKIEEIQLLEAYSKNDRWIFKWRLSNSKSTDLPWYFLNRHSAKSPFIESVSFDYDPLSSDR